MNLLIVDDQPVILQGILNGVQWDILQFEKVLTAKNYEQAVSMFSEDSIDILLTDIEMADKSGLDLIEWVNVNHASTQCIVLSCHDDFHLAQRAIRLECLDYVLKPVPYEILTQLLYQAQQRVREAQGQMLIEDYGRVYMRQLQGETPDSAAEGIVDMTTDYIKAHIGEDISVETLAKLAGLSPRHLSRLFQKKVGSAIGEYITEQRMLLASELLRDARVSVTLVSDRVGYNNYSYFIRQFRKRFGITPGEYQKQYYT